MKLLFEQLIAILTTTAMTMSLVRAAINPITINGRHFVDSVTNKPFFIKGVDYQPGGSSGVNIHQDPLSDPNSCARDIILFQDLGINTIRIYSVNPDLNHDKCMTMLAAAGIYLVLDVNSPLPNQNLNRYEPWTTYNEFYLEHIFKVVEQFSHYPNTLAFFAGNEVINDNRSAKASSTYMKGVIRDLKNYIAKNCSRKIPIGYSAADDLHYRISFAKYLECEDPHDQNSSVDFYGINSYQWCGFQDFHSSGYDILVDAYRDYTKPIFLSEYGCNEVTPRVFQEVGTLYSSQMTEVFSGGLVYEFSQEPNNYGLVEHSQDGSVNLLPDFYALKEQYAAVEEIDISDKSQGPGQGTGAEDTEANEPLPESEKKKGFFGKLMNAQPLRHANNAHRGGNNHLEQQIIKSAPCEETYQNLDISRGIPMSLADEMIQQGVSVMKGKFIPVTDKDLITTHEIYHEDGTEYENNKIEIKVDVYKPIEEKSLPVHFKNDACEYELIDDDEEEREEEPKILTYYKVF